MPLAVVTFIVLAAAGSGPRPATVAECDAREHQGDAEPYACFHRLVRTRPATRAEVERRLRARLAADAHDRVALAAEGLLARDRGNPEAESLLRKAADAMRRAGDARGEAHCWRTLVTLLLDQGRLAETDQALAQATRTAEASGDAALRASARVLAAVVAQRRLQYDKSWAQLKDVEPSVFPGGPPWLRAATLSAMAGALWGLGRRQDSLDCLERQLDVVHADGDRHQEASALFSLSVLVSRVSDSSERSNALLQEALVAAVESGNAPVEAAVRIGMAEDSESASAAWRIGQLERALTILRRTRELANTCFALRELARWLVEVPGGIPRAFAAAEEAIQRAREAGDRFHLTRGMVRRWSLAADYAPREAALRAGFETLDAVQIIRGLQRDEDARARVLADWAFVYQQVIGYLLAPPKGATQPSAADVERAFQVAERLRAQELLAALDVARSAALLGRARPEYAARQAVLDQIARTQQSLLNVGLPPPTRRERLAHLETLEIRERALRDRMASADDAFAAVLSPRLATVAEVQRALAPDQAMLAFALGQRPPAMALTVERPWLFVLTRDAVRTVPLPDEAVNPRRLVDAFAGLVARRDGAEGAGAARLYRDLLQDGLAPLPATVKRLVVVPDGALHRVPFDALRQSPASPPLATRFEVTLVPSASLWLRLRGRPQPARAALLALADPRWAGSDGVAIERQAALWQGLALGALPRGRREARVALRSLGGQGRLLAGVEATEHALKTADLGRYAILHVAAHAVVDDQNAERSAIVLAPGAPGEDGLLQSREIVGLDLSGLVVVLSACGSSSGEVLAGEGPLSLARAFLQAGARAVVGNLWEVRDDEAELLMGAFYRELGAGATVAAALAAARRERIAAGAPVAAWAGTVVLGNGAATITTPEGAREWRAVECAGAGLIAAGLLAPVAIWWRRRHPARR